MSGHEPPEKPAEDKPKEDKPTENKPQEPKKNNREETELTTVCSPNEG